MHGLEQSAFRALAALRRRGAGGSPSLSLSLSSSLLVRRYRLGSSTPATAFSTLAVGRASSSSSSSSDRMVNDGTILGGAFLAVTTAGMVLALPSLSTNTCCDKAEKETRRAKTKKKQEEETEKTPTTTTTKEEEDDEDDPYANLPEEDEPTDCSMCNTFRQGPCRTEWRKLERCLKDSKLKEGGAADHCIKYFMPHQSCLMGHMNLYLLIGHEMKQEIVQDAELSFTKPSERRSITMPEIDWSLYFQFLQEEGTSFRQTIPNVKFPKDTPLWKKFQDNTEPVLLNLRGHMPDIDQATGWILKVAYVLDQNGKVLGFTYNDHYGDLVKGAKQKEDEDGKETKEGEDKKKKHTTTTTTTTSTTDEPQPTADTTTTASAKKEYKSQVQIDFVLIPGETKSIQLKAYYSENPATADPSKEVLDGLLCSTPSVPLPSKP